MRSCAIRNVVAAVSAVALAAAAACAPRRQHTETGNGGNGFSQALPVFFFFQERVAETRCRCCRGSAAPCFRVLARSEEPPPHARAPGGPRDQQRANQRLGQQPQHPATGFRSAPHKGRRRKTLRSAVSGVSRSRCAGAALVHPFERC